jgi:hypothetical protein
LFLFPHVVQGSCLIAAPGDTANNWLCTFIWVLSGATIVSLTVLALFMVRSVDRTTEQYAASIFNPCRMRGERHAFNIRVVGSLIGSASGHFSCCLRGSS